MVSRPFVTRIPSGSVVRFYFFPKLLRGLKSRLNSREDGRVVSRPFVTRIPSGSVVRFYFFPLTFLSTATL